MAIYVVKTPAVCGRSRGLGAVFIPIFNFRNAMGVSIPQNPMIYRLTIEAYNDYVEDYNDNAAYYEAETGNPEDSIPRLQKLEDQYLHHEGDPFAYRNDNYTNPGITPLSDYFTLGTGGSAEFALTTTGEQTIETEIAHGFHYADSIVGGAVVKGGAYVNLDYTSGTGSFQTTGVSKETRPSRRWWDIGPPAPP